MSQHHLTMLHNGAPIHIQLGWDRPLHEFFMHVEKLIAHDDDDEVSPYLYSTFEDHELRSGCLNLEYFLDKLRSLDITPGGHPNCPTYGHPNCSTWPG